MNKIVASPEQAVADIPDGATVGEWKTYRMAFEKDAASIRQEPQTSASRP